jgi:hypothetical protein
MVFFSLPLGECRDIRLTWNGLHLPPFQILYSFSLIIFSSINSVAETASLYKPTFNDIIGYLTTLSAICSAEYKQV